MLDQSQLYTFIDKEKQFSLHFLEGQRLIYDLVLTQNLRKEEFDYFRSSVLGVQLMLGYLKQGEMFCFYIDSESPYFRLKIEMNAMGLMRGMIYSGALDAAPDAIIGQLRLLKFLPRSEMPYQSIIEIKNIDINEIINLVLSRSYQVNSRVFVSEDSDQSFMLNQLPLTGKEEPLKIEEMFKQYADPLKEIMKRALTNKEDIIKEMERYGFKYLASKPVQFSCGCSKEHMINNLKKLANAGEEDLFLPGQDAIEVVCEYCKTAYQVTRRDIQNSPSDYQ